jgi:HSP90 family molecular chaperone
LLALQESRVVRVIRKQLVKRSLDMLKEIAGRPADDKGKSDYDTFYEAFGRCVTLRVGSWSTVLHHGVETGGSSSQDLHRCSALANTTCS